MPTPTAARPRDRARARDPRRASSRSRCSRCRCCQARRGRRRLREPTRAILAMLLANVALPFGALAATVPPRGLVRAALPGALALPTLRHLEPRLAARAARFPFLARAAPAAIDDSPALVGRLRRHGRAVLACAVLAARARPALEPANRRALTTCGHRRAGAARARARLPALGDRGGDVDGRHEPALSGHRQRAVPLGRSPLHLSRHARRSASVIRAGSIRAALFMTLAVASLAWLIVSGPKNPFGVDAADSVGAAAFCALLRGSCSSACMVAHGELYRLRPGPPARLTAFYLCIAGGGALGGLFVGLIAPHVFDAYHELPIGLGLACVLAARRVARGSGGMVRAGRAEAGASAWRVALASAGDRITQGPQLLRPVSATCSIRSAASSACCASSEANQAAPPVRSCTARRCTASQIDGLARTRPPPTTACTRASRSRSSCASPTRRSRSA